MRYEDIIKIRAFEEHVLDLFGKGVISGTTHTYIGQEATAVAVMQFVRSQDNIYSNHRCHGHYLAYGGPAELLLAEIMSKQSGLCHGKGGSQHIHYRKFYTNGIQGGIVPNGLGMAYAEKFHNSDANTIVFLGDGTLGQGVVYETLNIAAIKSIPIMFVVEDNQYAMSSKRSEMIYGEIRERIAGFGIYTQEISSTDVDELSAFFCEGFRKLDNSRTPVCMIVHNYRMAAHSKGDDLRNPSEIEKHRESDPIRVIMEKLGEDRYREIYSNYRNEFSAITDKLLRDSFTEIHCPQIERIDASGSMLCTKEEVIATGIKNAFENRLDSDSGVVFLGEDICDPYGGAFKCTKGLSNKYKDRIINMPISEASMVGMAVGMSMKGMRPVVEMMFGDFISLGFDQILNHAVKYSFIYGDETTVPLVVRIPSGAQRGYGSTHSQSMEKYLVSVPQLRVIALSRFHDPGKIYDMIFQKVTEPTAVIENKKMYAEKCIPTHDGKMGIFEVEEVNHYGFSTIRVSMDLMSIPHCYVISYGEMAYEAILAAEKLMIEDEIAVEVLVLSQLSPLPIDDIKEIIKKESVIVTLEEGTKTGGICAEIITQCIENGIQGSYYRIATPDMPIPNGLELEKQIIPNMSRIVQYIERIFEYV